MSIRKLNPASSRVLVVSAELSDLLVVRRLVLETEHSVETARSAKQALALLRDRHFDVVIADDFGVKDGGGEHLLDEIADRDPATLRILVTQGVIQGVAHEQALHDERMFRVSRPYYAQALRALLTEHTEQLLAREEGDETAPTELWTIEDLTAYA